MLLKNIAIVLMSTKFSITVRVSESGGYKLQVLAQEQF